MYDDGEAKRDETAPRTDNMPEMPAETPPNGDEIASEAGPPPGPAAFDSALGAAILRINANLDLDTALAEVKGVSRASSWRTNGASRVSVERAPRPNLPGAVASGWVPAPAGSAHRVRWDHFFIVTCRGPA